MFELTRCSDRHAHIATVGPGLDARYRGSEVGHVQRARELRRDTSVHEVEQDPVALLAHVDHNGGVGELDFDAAFTLRPAPEIDVLQFQSLPSLYATIGRHGRSGCARCRHSPGAAARSDADEHLITLGANLMRHLLEQVDYHPGSISGLDSGDAARHTDCHWRHLRRQSAGRIHQVDRDACRVVCRESIRIPNGLAGRKHDLDPVAGQG